MRHFCQSIWCDEVVTSVKEVLEKSEEELLEFEYENVE